MSFADPLPCASVAIVLRRTWKFRFGNPTAPIRSHAALALRKCATPIPAVPLGASATKRPTANKLSLRLKITSSNYTAYCSGTVARVRIRSIAASTRRWTTTAETFGPDGKSLGVVFGPPRLLKRRDGGRIWLRGSMSRYRTESHHPLILIGIFIAEFLATRSKPATDGSRAC
jgi:hypothetical protein